MKRLRQQSDHQINTKNKVMMLFLTIVFLGAIVLGLLFLIPGFTFPIKGQQGHDVPRSIASLEKVNLGGQEQWILIRGMDITLMTQRRLLGKYGGELYGRSNGAFPLIFSSLICATEYTLLDKVNFFKGIFASNSLLWQELLTINLNKQILSFEVPIYFVLGRHDYEAPSILAEQYFKIIEAPEKEIIWFENSAHFANIEEDGKFDDLLIDRILPTIAII